MIRHETSSWPVECTCALLCHEPGLHSITVHVLRTLGIHLHPVMWLPTLVHDRIGRSRFDVARLKQCVPASLTPSADSSAVGSVSIVIQHAHFQTSTCYGALASQSHRPCLVHSPSFLSFESPLLPVSVSRLFHGRGLHHWCCLTCQHCRTLLASFLFTITG